jgi:TonB family protein
MIHPVGVQFRDEMLKLKLTTADVGVGLTVDTQGMPQNIHVVRSGGKDMDAKAIEAVKESRFKPAMQDGQPISEDISLNLALHFYQNKDDADAATAAIQQAGGVHLSSTPQTAPSAKFAVPGCTTDHAKPSEADTALLARKFADAERLYNASLAEEPTSTTAMAGLVRTTLAEDKLPEALAMAMKYDSAQPNDAVLLDVLGEVRFRRGEVQDAVKAFTQSVHINGCNGQTYYDIAQFLNLTGQHGSAQVYLERAYWLAPENQMIARRWNATHAVPPTNEQRLAALKARLDNPALTDAQKNAIDTSIKSIESEAKGSCELTSPVEEVKIPIIPISSARDPVEMSEAALDVYLNGKKQRLEIDTGASGLVVTSLVAKAVGLVPEVETKSLGLGDKGAASSFMTHVDDIRIGSMEFKNCRVQVIEASNEPGKVPDIGGLVGTDVFQNYMVTLDFPQRELLIGPLPKLPGETESKPTSLATTGDETTTLSIADSAKNRYTAPEMKDWVPLYRSGHFLILPTIVGKASVKLFIVDSGSMVDLISLEAARDVALLSGFAAPTLKGLNGEVQKVLVADKVPITFANVNQTVREMTSIDTTSVSRQIGVGISGFIGFPTLRELVLSIDYRDNLIHVVYDPKKGNHQFGPY